MQHSTDFRILKFHPILNPMMDFKFPEFRQVDLSGKIVLGQIFINNRSTWFPLLSACRLAEIDASVICHLFMHCLRSFLLQDMLLNLHEAAFEGQEKEIYDREHVAYLYYI